MKIVKTWHDTERDMDYARLLAKPCCAVINTYDNHLCFLKASIESVRKFNLFTILSYDNPFWAGNDREDKLPDPELLTKVDVVVLKHNSFQGGVTWPWIWHLKYVTPIIQELKFEYAFIMDGDSYYETPENFPELFKMIEGYDLLDYWYSHNKMGTQSWIVKVNALRGIIDLITPTFFKDFVSGTAEDRLFKAVKTLGLKVAPTMEKDFDFRLPPGEESGLFGKLLGLQHVHCQYKERRLQHLKPLDKSIVEAKYIQSSDGRPLEKYYETGDRKYLEKWWK